MVDALKRIVRTTSLSAFLFAFLSGIAVAGASPQMSQPAHPGPTEGLAFGVGAGVKFLNLKNIATRTDTGGNVTRSGDGFANTSSPVISLYGRKYMPDLLWIPTFWGLEFNYLTDMSKTSIHSSLTLPGGALDTGYRYQERWDARVMLGAQVWSGNQLDLWAQAGLQLTNFNYEGRTTEVAGGPTQIFTMDNNYALAPAGGLEIRFSRPGLLHGKVVTDFILGWTAGYRNAFKVTGTSTANRTYSIAMNANWNHTFGLKVLFRY
ncbi:MAG: hypothetical protein K0R52_455 [Alphaproteobacteria bacterium]|nr:hypothetical protein [Alphaproteobacteria bacterium]